MKSMKLVLRFAVIGALVLAGRNDDAEQALIGGESVRNGAGFAQIVRGDRVGVTDHLDIQRLNPALDQHVLSLCWETG